MGSVTGLMDDEGVAVEGYMYTPYGETLILGPGENGVLQWGYDLHAQPDDDQVLSTSAYGNPYQYTARRVDPETGLYYYRARMYDPDMGRFISRDPIGDWGDAGNMGNGYGYVGGAPTMNTDASGLCAASLSGPQSLVEASRMQPWWPFTQNPREFVDSDVAIHTGYNSPCVNIANFWRELMGRERTPLAGPAGVMLRIEMYDWAIEAGEESLEQWDSRPWCHGDVMIYPRSIEHITLGEMHDERRKLFESTQLGMPYVRPPYIEDCAVGAVKGAVFTQAAAWLFDTNPPGWIVIGGAALIGCVSEMTKTPLPPVL